MFCNKKYNQLKKYCEKLKNENGNLLEKNNGLKKEKGDLKNTLDKICSTLNSQTALESKPKKLSKQPKFFKFLISENSFHPKLTTRFNIIIIIIMLIIYLFTGYYITSESKYASFIYAIVSSLMILLFVTLLETIFKSFLKQNWKKHHPEKELTSEMLNNYYSEDLVSVKIVSVVSIVVINMIFLGFIIMNNNFDKERPTTITSDDYILKYKGLHDKEIKVKSKNGKKEENLNKFLDDKYYKVTIKEKE
ncbi:hypothetical protein [Staphylococcus epidermidis]|uniref:hypothetical protein n=1 Tax=Staphylococcus epidermidis TaxID=1282 RepID=UPI0035633443|nr:hypothetical protein [Staphylococcus epidermidis]